MRGAWQVGVLALGMIAGCGADLDFVPPEEVLVLSACPEGSRCEKVADGRSRITVEACVPDSVDTPRADAQVTLTLSSGSWEGLDATARAVSASIKTDPCFRPTIVTSTALTTLRVDAELVGVRQFIEIPLQAAPLTALELVPAPLQPRAGQETQLQVSVRAANGGLPTQGTRVVFAIESAEPATAQVGLWPDQTELDTRGQVVARLLPSLGVTQVNLRVQAFPPGSSAPTLERTFNLVVTAP
ncbi:hypothetical protein [Hyalangium versicolor]|uniref:hypothetical protein n=1 Tax=Hyalangium versicolor TaxID=2861190 RepID=UPI001CC92545|nr:hypothetical protein [Hyalangium versicolor]